MHKFLRLIIILTICVPAALANAKAATKVAGNPVADVVEEAKHTSTDQLLQRLDEAVDNYKTYRKKREQRITKLRAELSVAAHWKEQYAIMNKLHDEYRVFLNDSAILWQQRCLDGAKMVGEHREVSESRCRMSTQYLNSGYYAEARFLIDSLESTTFADAEVEYYYIKSKLYYALARDTRNAKSRQIFTRIAKDLSEKLLLVAPENSEARFNTLYFKLLDAEDYIQALALCNHRLKQLEPDDQKNAVVNFRRYTLLEKLQRPDEAFYCLLQAAICDVESATYDEQAIYNVSRVLNDRGDVKRSRKYMEYAYYAYTQFGGITRGWVVHDMEDTNRLYLSQLNEKQSLVNISLYIIIILFIISVTLLVFSHRQRHKVKEKNMKINEANLKLSDTNEQLTKLYEQNADLAASVLVGTPCRSCEDGADNHFNFETFAVKAHGDHGVGCSQFPVGADVACCIEKLCCDLVQYLSFEWNALGQDNVECRDSVCCHHDDELVVDVVHVTHLAVIYTFLSVKMEICLCKCFHLCL